MKQKTNRLHFSTRTLAMVLSIVMLIGSIATGSMLNTFAAYMKDNVNSDAVSQAATEGGAIALNAITDKGSDEAVDAAPADNIEANDEDDDIIPPDLSKLEESSVINRFKDDLVSTGANVDLAFTKASSYKLQTGARYYLNTYASDGKPFGDSATKAYVYCAFIWNDYQNYSIIKMDKIANTDWYTCVTADGNIVDGSNTERRGDMDGVCFFTSDSSSWATKSKYFDNKGAFADIQTYAKVLDCYSSSLDGRSALDGHSYYYSIAGNTWDYSDGTLANSASQTKTSWQKTTVYKSTDGSDYSQMAGAGEGGEVQIGSYYWATAYTTSDKGFAPASDNSTRYSQYNNAVVTSWVTLKVTDTYDGWHFMGWYDSSGNPAGTNPTSLTNYYQITSTSTFDVHARFLKPEYSAATPASASTASNMILIDKSDRTDAAPYYLHIWQNGSEALNTDDQSTIAGNNTKHLTQIDSTNYYIFNLSKQYTLINTIVINNVNNWDTCTRYSKDINSGSSTDGVFYHKLASSIPDNNQSWGTFTHLGATGLSNNKTTAAIGEEVTLTATAPSTGTLKSGVTYSYYYTTDNSTWYQISAGGTNTTQKFYPPANGVYTYKVTVTDSAGLETVDATANDTTTVGVVGGKYLAGTANLLGGTDWAEAQDKGLMTETSTANVYTKTFGNVAAGTYQFRVTTLENNGTVTWETDSGDAISGTASPTHAGPSNNNIQFVLTENKKVTITYNDSTKAVTVDVDDVQAIDVVVYAGPGGSVEVTYGTAVTTIEENDNATIKVAYGDSIDLEATGEGSEFSNWYKNLNNNYKGTPAKVSGYDSLEHEVITQRTVYVACFEGGSASSSWIYSADRSNASPEISGDASSYHMLYNSDKSKLGREAGNPSGDLSTYQSGSDYWCDLTSVFGNPPSTPSTLYIALSTNDNNSGIRGDKSNMKINGTTYTQGNGPSFKNTSDETLFRTRFQEYNDVSGSAYFIEIYDIAWSKITALGVRAVYTGSGGVNYKFYYKTSGSGGGGGGGSSYIPSTNFYAKDASVRNVTGESVNGLQYNFWIYPTRTEVESVDGQVVVQKDHEANGSAIGGHNQWVEGLAMKGSEITVSTIIPHRGSYNVTNSSGVTSTVNADDKYYVKGFSFNGVTPELLEASDGVSVASFTTYETDGTTWTGSGTKYTCTYKIPANMKEAKLEITPILFVKDAYASETVMVYIDGYNTNVQNAGWGNTLYVYPFYQYYKNGSSGTIGTYYGQGENFGRYPGQPVINYGGQRYMQIPLTDDASAKGKDNNDGPIKGITINNGYYDYVHKDCCDHVSIHRQTYDYDDFAKIYNEKKTKNGSKYLYNINFSFKYFAQNSSQQHRLANTTNGITGNNNASRYNDLLSENGILSNTNGTVASSTLITAGENSTGWEDLQDSLGNKVDLFGNKVTNVSAEPLRVFSLGYEYNNAGRWATEWAVYHKNGNNYELIKDPNKPAANQYSTIVPSALIYNDKASLAAATSMDGDLGIKDYAGIYEALEAYRGVPVKICYEHDIPDAFNPKNYRCDGRWTYTTVDDFVRSNVKIQYYDKDGILHDDTYANDASVVGQTTGCSAYFTNSEYYGKRVSDSELIDNFKSYTFTADQKGSYEFVGWYMYDTAGHESTITTSSMTADTPRSGNFVLAARYKYIASGNLTISNTLNDNSTGRGTTYLGVTVKNGDKETVVANVNSNTSSVTLDKSYINANSNYQIIVQLKTVPVGENTFSRYDCYTTEGYTGNDGRSKIMTTNNIYDTSQSGTHSQANSAVASYTITVKGDIFDEITTNQQNVKAIEYVSELNPVHYTYSVTYNYTSRQYGDQAFTREGTLTPGQINDRTVVTGTSGNADKKLTKEFLASIAPHESNFNEKITWNFDGLDSSQTCTYTSGTNTYNISLNIAKANATIDSTSADFSKVRHGYFTVPYSQTNGVANDDGSGKVAKTAEPTTFTIDLNYDDLFKINGNFVTAPTIIYETVEGVEHARYFKYWEMSTVSSKRGDSRVVGKCYFPEFNYRALDNYNITAVYSVEGEELNGNPVAENSYAAFYSNQQFTSIDFIGNSRNQWNNSHGGTVTGAHTTAGDLIYNDFILSFKPEGEDLFKDLTGTVSCGVVIERVKFIETNSSGTNAKTLQEYAKDYTDADLATIHGKIETYVSSNFTNKGGLTLMNRTVTKTDVNTKNRCHYVLPMYNNPTGSDLVGNNQKYLYRAYSYMIIDGEVTISDAPTYFYMYDIAVA